MSAAGAAYLSPRGVSPEITTPKRIKARFSGRQSYRTRSGSDGIIDSTYFAAKVKMR